MTKIAGSGSGSEPGSGSNSQMHGYADPDPHQNVMDPEHWSLQCTAFILTICTHSCRGWGGQMYGFSMQVSLCTPVWVEVRQTVLLAGLIL